MELHRKSNKEKYKNKLLVWAKDIATLRNSNSDSVTWHTEEGARVFSKESIIDAIDNRLGAYCPYPWGDTYFISIDYSALEEIASQEPKETDFNSAMKQFIDDNFSGPMSKDMELTYSDGYRAGIAIGAFWAKKYILSKIDK